MDTDPETSDYISERPIDMTSSFDFGDELPEIQQKFRESVDFGHEVESISKYILGIDDLLSLDQFYDKNFEIKQSTDKFRKFKETFKLEIEEESVLYSDKRYNLNPIADILKNNDKGTYFNEPMFAIHEEVYNDFDLIDEYLANDGVFNNEEESDFGNTVASAEQSFSEKFTTNSNPNITNMVGVDTFLGDDSDSRYEYDFSFDDDSAYSEFLSEDFDDLEDYDDDFFEIDDFENKEGFGEEDFYFDDDTEYDQFSETDYFNSISRFDKSDEDDLIELEDVDTLDFDITGNFTEYDELDYDN